MKRVLDILISLIGLILSLPIFLIIGILIKLNLKGSVIFKQERAGKSSKTLCLYKFKTMRDLGDKNGNLLPDKERLTKIGSHSVITPGVTVGENSIVGAFSFINKDIPANITAFGIPVKIIKNNMMNKQ